MEYIIEDEFVIELEPVIKPKPEAEVEIELPVIAMSNEETPDVSPLQVLDYGTSSIEVSFATATERAEEVVKGVLCGTENPPTFENADYRLLHGQGSMDLAFAGLHYNTEYYLRPYALSNLGYKYGDIVAQRTKSSPIPDEYQLVEWIGANGRSFIVLDYRPSSISAVHTKIRYNTTSNTYCYFGCQDSGNNRAFKGYFYAQTNYRYGNSTVTAYNPVGIDIDVNFSSSRVITTVNSIENVATFSPSSHPMAEYNLCLFANNSNGAIQQIADNGLIYFFEVIEYDDKVIELYPVYRKSDNKPGMYDIVNNQFYLNQGTGEFLVGPDKEWEE